MSDLRSIVYVSTATVKFSTADLEALLVEARTLNRENNITGVLLYDEGNFMQCFEGPEDAVADTYDRIRQSHRHRDILELMNERVLRRSFQDWEMGLARPTKSELLNISTAVWKKQLNSPGNPADFSRGFSLLKVLWKTAQRKL